MEQERPDNEFLVLQGEYGGRTRTVVVVTPPTFQISDPEPIFSALMDHATKNSFRDTGLLVSLILPGPGDLGNFYEFSYVFDMDGDVEEVVDIALSFLSFQFGVADEVASVNVYGAFTSSGTDIAAHLLLTVVGDEVWPFVLACTTDLVLDDALPRICASFAQAALQTYETATRTTAWIVADGLALGEGDPDAFLVLPYARRAGAAPGDLAVDALRALSTPIRVDGPFRLAGLDFHAYLLTGHFAGEQRRVCIVEPLDGPPISGPGRLPGSARWQFFKLLGEASVTQRQWPDDLIWCVWPLEPPVWLTYPMPPVSDDPRRNAEAALFFYGVKIIRARAVAYPKWSQPTGQGSLLAAMAEAGMPNPRAFLVHTDPNLPPTLMIVEGADTEEEQRVPDIDDDYRVIEADAFLRETYSAIDRGLLNVAFRSYAYHRYFGAPDTPEQVGASLGAGISLANRLKDVRQYDLAEWAASWAASLAEQHGAAEAAVKAHWVAGVCCDYMGWLTEALDHYEAALRDADALADEDFIGTLEMSVGITTVTAFADYEPEARFLTPLNAEQRTLLERASRLLDAADEIYAGRKDRERSRTTIAIYRERVAGLLALDDDSVLASVENLVDLWHSPAVSDDERLRQTAGSFITAGLWRLAATPPEVLPSFDNAANAVMSGLTSAVEVTWAKITSIAVLFGDRLHALDAPEEALASYEIARNSQVNEQFFLIRPPRPTERHGGSFAIDVVGRRLRMAAEHPELTRDRATEILLDAENAKSRWFTRDLVMALPNAEPAARAGATLPVGALTDPRIALAERAWERWQETGDDSLDDPPGLLDETGLADLWELLPERAAILSFYSANDRTYVTTLRNPGEQPVVTVLPVDQHRLDKASRLMSAYFSGTGLYAALDPRDPARRDARFLGELRRIGDLLAPIADAVADSALIVVLPHQQWHGLPIHASLLPRLWEAGRRPGLAYAPSLDTLRFLLRRDRERPDPRFVRAGVLTAPGPGDDSAAFEAAHSGFAAALADHFGTVLSACGPTATKNELLYEIRHAGLQHLIAHGSFHDGADVMDSALALTPGPDGVPELMRGRDLISLGIRASHVTVQACSLGRSVASAGDEMWGPTRALLAAGAGSVLSPLWNIDLTSSTQLLHDFYDGWLERRLPKWQALADAQFRMWSNGESPAWQHMFHWAPFKLVGL
ncbi:CHAT domain-containing protein [Streptosporangium sp. NPDC049046]|uniref:CHAT domain-containing protein n=1 Tax=Streptosporangium sp. NPDC049046 TaxID=3155031 RepID=UPI003419B629